MKRADVIKNYVLDPVEKQVDLKHIPVDEFNIDHNHSYLMLPIYRLPDNQEVYIACGAHVIFTVVKRTDKQFGQHKIQPYLVVKVLRKGKQDITSNNDTYIDIKKIIVLKQNLSSDAYMTVKGKLLCFTKNAFTEHRDTYTASNMFCSNT